MRSEQVNQQTVSSKTGNTGGHVLLCPDCRSGQVHYNSVEGKTLTSKCSKCGSASRFTRVADAWIPEEFIPVLDSVVNAEIEKQYEKIEREKSQSPEPEHRRGILQRMKPRSGETASVRKRKESHDSKPAAGGARQARGMFFRRKLKASKEKPQGAQTGQPQIIVAPEPSESVANKIRPSRHLFARKPKLSQAELEAARDDALEEARTYKALGNIDMARKRALEAKKIQERIQ